MIIRKAEINDSEGIGNVLMNSYNIDSIEEGITVFKNELAKESNYIVANDKGIIIGIVSWVIRGLPKHGLIELDRIAVLPEYKGKGIASKLFEVLKKQAIDFYELKGCKLRKIFLLTHADNLRAQSFYEKIGFQYEALLKNHYYKGINEMVFGMFLD